MKYFVRRDWLLIFGGFAIAAASKPGLWVVLATFGAVLILYKAYLDDLARIKLAHEKKSCWGPRK